MKVKFLTGLIFAIMASVSAFARQLPEDKPAEIRNVKEEVALSSATNTQGTMNTLNSIRIDGHTIAAKLDPEDCPSGLNILGDDISGTIYLGKASGYSACIVRFATPYKNLVNCYFSSNQIHNHTLETHSLGTHFRIASDDGFNNRESSSYEEIQYNCFTR